jgi:hypoxanthine-DNA glycosylase
VTLARSFLPCVGPATRLLVLGSLPGQRSLTEQRYYAHPQNQFWRLIGAVIARDIASLDYDARLAALAAAGIGLWDVVARASRAGSLDSAIRLPEPNDVAALVQTLPGIAAIAFNGAAAWRIGAPALGATGLPLLRLPSSSPAHAALSFEAKRAAWMPLQRFLAG